MNQPTGNEFFDGVMGAVRAQLGTLISELADAYSAMQSVNAFLLDNGIMVTQSLPWAWKVIDYGVGEETYPTYPIAVHKAMERLIVKLGKGGQP